MSQKPINIVVENRLTQGKVIQDFKDKFKRKPTNQGELMSFVQVIRENARVPLLCVEAVESNENKEKK